MATNNTYIYWDSCVFLSYVAATPGRIDVLDELLDLVSRSTDTRIITSSIVITEVVFGSGHGPARRDPAAEAAIDELLFSSNVVMVDAFPHILLRARDLMRQAKDMGYSLKPNDAIHLATAMTIDDSIGPVKEVHTYDDWPKYGPLTGLNICTPRVDQPRLLSIDPESE